MCSLRQVNNIFLSKFVKFLETFVLEEIRVEYSNGKLAKCFLFSGIK